MMISAKFNPRGRALYEDNASSVSPLDVLFFIVLAALVALMIFVTLFSKCVIIGDSMKNKLHDGDNILITNYKSSYKNNDIIILTVPGEPKPLVKRIVATGGESFYFYTSGEYVFLYKKTEDGIFLSVNETYLPEAMLINSSGFRHSVFSFFDPSDPSTVYTVPDGCYLFLGDNRNISLDARTFSYAAENQIIGKMVSFIEPDSFLDFVVNILFSKKYPSAYAQ